MSEIIVGAGKTRVRSVTKVVVPGNRTIVKKVIVGTPTKVGLAAQGFLVNLSDVNSRVDQKDGTLLRYDSATDKYKHVELKQVLGQNVSITNTGDFASLAFDWPRFALYYEDNDISTESESVAFNLSQIYPNLRGKSKIITGPQLN